MPIGTNCLLAIREWQDLLTQTAVLGEGLLIHLLGDMSNQDLVRHHEWQSEGWYRFLGAKGIHRQYRIVSETGEAYLYRLTCCPKSSKSAPSTNVNSKVK